jgi:hypothetical protein
MKGTSTKTGTMTATMKDTILLYMRHCLDSKEGDRHVDRERHDGANDTSMSNNSLHHAISAQVGCHACTPSCSTAGT